MDFASFTKEQRNYFALSYLLVDVGTSTLRRLFDEFHPPENLHEHLARSDLRRTLRSLFSKGIIPFSQWEKLYPPFPSSVTSENFDMSLLVVLLRNLCDLTPPITGWNNLTHDPDRSVAANISRITTYKSTFYTRARQTSVDDTTFNFLWEEISRALIELGADEKAINRLKTGSKDAGELKKVSAVSPGHHPGTHFVYKMTALPRGITLIINNKLFADNPVHGSQTPRHGSEEDVHQLKELFGALGFDVHIRENRTKQEMLDDVDFFAYKRVIPDHDCFVLWLMSHGRSGEVFGSDGVPLPIQTIKDMLSNASCEALRGKPKLLFVQACRGDEEDEGVLTNSCGSPAIQGSCAHSDSPSDPTISPSSERIAGQTDFLTAYSTVEGYVSYRYPGVGSNFVRAVVNVFREYVAHDHLVNLLTKVIKRVSDMESEEDARKFKQAPQFETTLVKELWF